MIKRAVLGLGLLLGRKVIVRAARSLARRLAAKVLRR